MFARPAAAASAPLGCPRFQARLACVDLTRQTMWVTERGKTVWGPVPIRSGRPGYETRTGWHAIEWKAKEHWSTLYNAPMPYSQFFSGGQAFHGTYTTIYTPSGSHGCVNLHLRDARQLWNLLTPGTPVYIWGARRT
ncbi:L,D-transpeptidase [Streptomyces sp. NPDC059002]|uniref:L,D-transpeptidase n=1 Tax=Streptomyces sp. NPDC059002 TaxID=3346690 RepID=UPI003695D3C1